MKRSFWKDTGGFLAALAVMAALALALHARAATVAQDPFAAVCRITTPAHQLADGRSGVTIGSGAVIGLDRGYAVVLTNDHIARPGVLACEFWSQGHQSAKLPGQRLCSDPTLDAAIVLVPASAFAGRTPKPLAIAKQSPGIGSLIRSVGCAEGSWATAFEGHVTRHAGLDFFFVPCPAQGRSGSAVTNDRGELCGLLKWQTTDKTEGGATAIEPLYTKLQAVAQVAYTTFVPDAQLTACGPYGCDSGNQEDLFGRPPYLFPRLHQQPAAPNPASPWPTLAPQSEKTDLAPVIDAIGNLQRTIQAQPVIPPTPAQTGPDPATLATLDAHGKAIQGLSEGLTATNKAVTAIGENQAKHGTILEQLAATRAKVQEEEPGASKVKQELDTLKEWNSTHKWLWIIVAFVGVVVFLACWHRYGVGLIAKTVQDIAAKHPENQQLQTFSQGLTSREQAIGSHVPFLVHLAPGQPGTVTGGVAVAPATGTASAGVGGGQAGGDATNAAVTAALVQGAIQTALNTPAPGQATTIPAPPSGTASPPAPAGA